SDALLLGGGHHRRDAFILIVVFSKFADGRFEMRHGIAQFRAGEIFVGLNDASNGADGSPELHSERVSTLGQGVCIANAWPVIIPVCHGRATSSETTAPHSCDTGNRRDVCHGQTRYHRPPTGREKSMPSRAFCVMIR
ncbi:MAG: hypothetical protein KC983_09900, partial [Phycisphaerales bacterium]|nr:hypothetical protein [Phycisphaerales bacterium]